MNIQRLGRSLPVIISDVLSFRRELQQPRLAAAFALALVAAVIACWPTWPGYMSYDTLFAWRESYAGIDTAVYPPMQAYLSWISRVLTGGPGGYFFSQVFVLFFSSAVIISLYAERRATFVVAFGVYALLFLYFPTLAGVLAVIWKDVTTASFALLGLALWLVAVRRASFPWLAAAIVALSLGVAMRYNAIPLILPLMALIVISPFGGAQRPKAHRIAAGMAVLGLVAAYGSTTWRLPDLHKLPSNRGFAGVQEFDLLGITACSDRSYIPLAMSSGQAVTPEQVRLLYDPRHVQMAFHGGPGQAKLVETDAGGEVGRMWRKALGADFGCYLAHRNALFVEQMGLAAGHVFYPTHGGIDENPWGIKLAHPQSAKQFNGYVASSAAGIFRRPAWLYLLAVLGVMGLFAARGPGRAVMMSVLLGAFAYPATLFFVGPAADARYIFPSNVFCLLTFVLSAMLAAQKLQRTGVAFDQMRDHFSRASAMVKQRLGVDAS